ncbi:MAG: hypothetical protein KC800_09355 [Candidatus Eremiobacteraeota bacterium]|nr:hypothetical protein [Candidatus Eremiobacteraeota bacterium]
MLIAESIVASFLMLFAFAASAALFDAALRWESDGTNLRRAAMIADKRMEELREWVSSGGSGSTFPSDGEWAAEAVRITNYPEAPGFEIAVKATLPQYAQLLNTTITPPDGFHSPCSSLYTPPPGTAGGVPNPSDNVAFLDDHPQFNHRYKSYPYSREMPDSFRLVEIVVSYGGGANPRTYRLMSVIGDPLPAGAATVTVSPSSGLYQATVSVGGKTVPDMVVDWGNPINPGNGNQIGAYTKPTTATATVTDVQAMPGNSGTYVLGAKVRYKGQSYTGSLNIGL